MRHQRLSLFLQVLLVLVASLLGIVTNYATNAEHAPLLLRVLQKAAVPAIGVLIVALVAGHVVAFRLDRPPPPRRTWRRDRTPFPGLDAFTEDEAPVFFGREVQTAELTRRLHASGERSTDRFTVLVGASGSGKSSLVQAGLLPRLRERRWLILPVITPGADPIAALASAVAQAGGAPDRNAAARRLRRSPDGLAELLRAIRRSTGHRHRRILLVVDQLEETLTLTGAEERRRCLDAVVTALERDGRFCTVATARVEFLREFLDTPHARLFQAPLAIGALTRTLLAQVIERPAELVDLRFEPGLVQLIVDDAGTTDALPLLAYLLQELYFTAGPGALVTESAYRALGGVAGAMTRQADQVVAGLRGEDGIEPVLAVLLKFVTIEGQDAVRRRVPLEDLTEAERTVVDTFVDARLLVTGAAGGPPFAQVAHEALFRQWPPLRQEVEAKAEQLRRRGELERWAADWERAGRSADYLLTGERLALAGRWLAGLEESGQPSARARALVEASQRRDLAFLRQVSERVGEHVLANAERYPDLSTLLSLTALSDCPPTPAAVRALMAALAFNHLSAVLAGHGDAVRHVAWSPDGTRIATASRDGTARIWDAAGATATVLGDHAGMVEMAAWSPGSTRVATASRDGTVGIWDAATGLRTGRFTDAADVVRAVAWSPDGRWIASGSRDLSIRIYEADTAELVGELRGHTDNILGLAWSPDSTRLASGSHDRTVRIWSAPAAELQIVLRGPEDFVEGVAWHPDGTRVAAASGDQTVRVFDVRSGGQTMLIRAHEERAWNVAWSPDGTRLASCGGDRTARIWDPDTAQEIAALRGHLGDVWSVAWSPDGARLATGSADGTARVWDLVPRGAEEVLMAGHRGAVRGVAVQALNARDHVMTCSDDGTVRLWDGTTGRPRGTIDEHGDAVLHVEWSHTSYLACSAARTIRHLHVTRDLTVRNRWTVELPDTVVECVTGYGSRVASAGRDCKIRLWNAADGAPLAVLTGHQDWVVGLAWSPSGHLLASTSDDRTARIWDALAARQRTVLRGHGNWVDGVSWSPDERLVVTCSADRTARIWAVAGGDQVAVLAGHEARVHAVAWSPDGTRIATASYDRTVRVWDARGHTEIGVVGVHRDRVTCVAWTSDSRHVVTGSYDGTARVWKAEPDLDALKAAARNRAFRTLTEDERRAHLLPAGDP
ncbi:WD40 repeat domain-containing protein [Actinomadura fibrosa]|uniref:AAA family ATPase n=1 Tax=Actinomadura fibrosa TaxID=111802 RepID=A0ABW2XFH6_9ACTN|nr:WD40 repeat domain-containing protein [Actinomadura fibrosa]